MKIMAGTRETYLRNVEYQTRLTRLSKAHGILPHQTRLVYRGWGGWDRGVQDATLLLPSSRAWRHWRCAGTWPSPNGIAARQNREQASKTCSGAAFLAFFRCGAVRCVRGKRRISKRGCAQKKGGNKLTSILDALCDSANTTMNLSLSSIPRSPATKAPNPHRQPSSRVPRAL